MAIIFLKFAKSWDNVKTQTVKFFRILIFLESYQWKQMSTVFLVLTKLTPFIQNEH